MIWLLSPKSIVESISSSIQPRQEGSEWFVQQMAPSFLPNRSVTILFLEKSQTPPEMKWILTDLLTGVFDLKSSRCLYVTSYAICHLPLILARSSALKRWQNAKHYPVRKITSSDPCQLRLPVTDQCHTYTAEERLSNHCRAP